MRRLGPLTCCVLVACTTTHPDRGGGIDGTASRPSPVSLEAPLERDVPPPPAGSSLPAAPVAPPPPGPPPSVRQLSVGDARTAYVVLPARTDPPARLLVMIHGACTAPSYVCGAWKGAASSSGLLVCPTGNATCGPDGTGAPTWEEPFAAIDADVERAVAAVARLDAGVRSRDGAVLLGYSRGGYAAVALAERHPGRWPYLVINEADATLTSDRLRRAGVRAVALIAGAWGDQLEGERRSADALAADGFPARLWVMQRTGHPYSSDIDAIMGEAVRFVVSVDAGPPPPVP